MGEPMPDSPYTSKQEGDGSGESSCSKSSIIRSSTLLESLLALLRLTEGEDGDEVNRRASASSAALPADV